MSFMKKSAAGLVLTASALAASTAFAAGFQLTEQSSLGLGRAYAGAGIVGDDLSAVHYNPAGMTLLPGTQVQAGAVRRSGRGPGPRHPRGDEHAPQASARRRGGERPGRESVRGGGAGEGSGHLAHHPGAQVGVR